jgi:ribose transport system permease protein
MKLTLPGRPVARPPGSAQTAPDAGPPQPRRRSWQRGRGPVRDLWIGGVLIVIVIGFSIASPYFLTQANWLNTSSTATEVLLLAVGETFVICTGGIDLSVGAVLGFSGMAGAWVMAHWFAVTSGPDPLSVAVGFLVAVVAGGVFGAVNGVLVARTPIPPLVVTLGTLGIATGLGNLLNNGQEISTIPGSVATFGNTNLGGWVPVPVLIAAVITAWCGIVLAKTRFGAYTLSIGDSRESVVRAGINDRRHLFKVYLICGLLAGVAGVLVMARLGAGNPASGSSDNLNAIAAVVIGGTSLFGGRGTVVGSVIGTFIIAVLVTGLVITNVPPFWQEVAVGVILILAVWTDQLHPAGGRTRRRSHQAPPGPAIPAFIPPSVTGRRNGHS